jgi:hypothetical protein
MDAALQAAKDSENRHSILKDGSQAHSTTEVRR